jgi:hypothetical protein
MSTRETMSTRGLQQAKFASSPSATVATVFFQRVSADDETAAGGQPSAIPFAAIRFGINLLFSTN